MKNSRKVGEKIKRVRKMKNMTILTLSERTGVNKNTISKAENGDKSISLDSLEKIADGLSVPLADLIDDRPIGDIDYILHLRTCDAQKYIKAPRELRNYLRGKTLKAGERKRKSKKNVIGDLNIGLNNGSLLAAIIEVGCESEKPHCHDGEELFFCLTGKILITIEGEEIELHKGDAILFWGGIEHTYRSLEQDDEEKIPVGLSVISNSKFDTIEGIWNDYTQKRTE